jgi:hypothetical protein
MVRSLGRVADVRSAGTTTAGVTAIRVTDVEGSGAETKDEPLMPLPPLLALRFLLALLGFSVFSPFFNL